MTEGQRPEVTGELLCQRYRLQELVGRGAAAAVYRAVDEALGRQVALKVFAREGGEPELLARQEAEIRILASLIHPSLVTMFDAGTDPAMARSFVVMEYVGGPDLRRHLRTDSMAAADIAVLGADVACALDYVHSRGVIHRDIKPGNVLLYNPRPGDAPAPWRAKLTDFGIARVLEEEHLTGTGRMVGTAAYLSPEQALGEPLDGASDVYSLGLVLLECFTHRVEFPGSQIESGVARIHRNPAIPDTIGPEWKALLTSMTARLPADRPSARDAAAVLQQLATASESKVRAEALVRADVVPSPGVGSAPRPPIPAHQPTVALAARRNTGKRARRAMVASMAAVILACGTSATLGGSSPDGQAAPDRPAVPVLNNPLDFHLRQLEAALQPSAAILPILDQVRQAITGDNPQAALTQLDRLERAATDEAARNGLTFEQYRDITTAVRLVRNDLQTLIAASAKPPVQAVPVAPQPVPAAAPENIPAVNPEPAPTVVVENPSPAAAPGTGDDAPQQAQVAAGNSATNGAGGDMKAKPDKANNQGGSKGNNR